MTRHNEDLLDSLQVAEQIEDQENRYGEEREIDPDQMRENQLGGCLYV